MINKLNYLNPHISIKPLDDKSFKKYGKIHSNVKTNNMIKFLLNTTMNDDDYLPHCPELYNLDESSYFKELCYGQVPCQIGYFNSYNTKLNALEYHKCSETLITGTDLVILLASIDDLDENFYLNSKKITAFFVPKNTILELYANTLHFAPCMATKDGVRQIVILSNGTNTPLNKENIIRNSNNESKLLFEKNKWVIVHDEFKSLISKGAYIGITGENININYIK